MRPNRKIQLTNLSQAEKCWLKLTNKFASLECGTPQLYGKTVESILNRTIKKPRSVLDLGAGFGPIANIIARLNTKVIAVEPDKTAIKELKKLKSDNKIRKKLKIIEAQAESLPIRSKSIDLCIMSQVLEHVKNPDETISEVARVLKKHGYLYISSPNYLFPMEQHYRIPYWPLMKKGAFSKWAVFLLKTLNIRHIDKRNKNDFSMVASFIFDINYTTESMIKRLARKHKLKIVWSASEEEQDISAQIVKHWRQNPTLIQAFLITASLPKKIGRCLLAHYGVLPMKLELALMKN